MLVNWLATSAAHDVLNPSRQYAGLFGLAAAEALIFAPFLYYVFNVEGGGAVTVGSAAVVTVIGFAGLTVVGPGHPQGPLVPPARCCCGPASWRWC